MLKHCPGVAICRMALMFGISRLGAKSFIQPMIAAMRKSRVLRLFVDEFRTPISVKAAISGIFLALEKVRGLIHLGGVDRISRYDFGRLLMDILDIQTAKVLPCEQKDIVMAAPRPQDVSLDSSKVFALGFKPLSLIEELKALRGVI